MTQEQELKELGPESRLGYGGTFVFVGEIVTVKAKGFGRGCLAEVLELGEPGYGSMCKVKLVKVGKNNSGWTPENRTTLCCGSLEGIRM